MVLYQTYTFCPTLSLDWLSGNQKAQFAKNIKKINSSEAIWGMELKRCRTVHSNNFYKNIVFFCFVFFFFVVVCFVFFVVVFCRCFLLFCLVFCCCFFFCFFFLFVFFVLFFFVFFCFFCLFFFFWLLWQLRVSIDL